MVEAGHLNAGTAKAILAEMFGTGEAPAVIARRRGHMQLSDTSKIETLVKQVLAANPQQVLEYLAGNKPLAQWLFGQVMRSAIGRANPALVKELLQARRRALQGNRRAL
jgi:aspartyl-tRNA(Asn)/glutamyl-tRNA(Gln) amidotransferase subunit B